MDDEEKEVEVEVMEVENTFLSNITTPSVSVTVNSVVPVLERVKLDIG